MAYDIDLDQMLREPMHSWQSSFIKELENKVNSGGWKLGELSIMTASRGTGKSWLNNYYGSLSAIKIMPKYEMLESAVVDGADWHTIKCNAEVARWIRTANKNQWYEHRQTSYIDDRNIFDMDARLYTILQLKF